MARLRDVDANRRGHLASVGGVAKRGISPRTPGHILDSTDVIDSHARLRALARYAPRLPSDDIDALHVPVVAAVTRTNFVSDNVDRTRLSVLYRYAAWVLHTEGAFDLGKLDDRRLHTYRLTACTTLRPSSQNTAFSILRTIRHAAPAESGLRMTRNAVTSPYDDEEWAAFQRAADGLVGHPWHADCQMLLDLSGGVGLRSREINALTGRHLTQDVEMVILITPGDDSREIVAKGPIASRLRPWIGRSDHLLRPAYTRRGNTANFVADRVAHHNQAFTGFQCRRARHRWIAQLMGRPIPTLTVLHMAGLESDNHTLTDIARHLRLSSTERRQPRP